MREKHFSAHNQKWEAAQKFLEVHFPKRPARGDRPFCTYILSRNRCKLNKALTKTQEELYTCHEPHTGDHVLNHGLSNGALGPPLGATSEGLH